VKKSEEIKKLEYKIELLRSRIEEKRNLFLFENAFFLPLFVLLLFVSYAPVIKEVKIFLFVLTILLVVIDIVYAITVFYKIKHKQEDLDSMIKKKIGLLE